MEFLIKKQHLKKRFVSISVRRIYCDVSGIISIIHVGEDICGVCGIDYNEDDYQDAWIGCDNDCGRWYPALLVCWF